MSFDPPRPAPTTASKALQARNQEGNDFVKRMREITDLLQTNMLSAQASQEQFANRNQSPAPAYKVGDIVLLSTRNIALIGPINKFNPKFLGPYHVTAIPNSYSYQLDLPNELSLIHNVFHVNLLRPAPNDPLPSQKNPPPPPITIDDSGETL
jgi:hypothetical protein